VLSGITTVRYTMIATVLHPTTPTGNDPVDPSETGTWQEKQDPITGEIIRVWVPSTDNPDTPDVNEAVAGDIPCMARGIVDGGIRAAATTETFGDTYRNIDIVHMWFPPNYRLTKRDRITNIRTKSGVILWRDEEYEDTTDIKATVFNVNGVIPQFDPFNRLVSNFALLERAEV